MGRRKKLQKHRKSNSFSSFNQLQKNEESKDDDFEIMDDEQLIAEKLKFDAFKTQKRNTGIGHMSRSQTVDLTNSPKLQSLHLTVNDEHDRIVHKSNKSKRSRLSVSKQTTNGQEASDVIEISLRIDRTKKGYLFIGIIPCNKINSVVQPGFMFGFSPYSYSFHGYSGKIYHDKMQSDYCFSSHNTSNAKKNKQAKTASHSRSNTVDITLSSASNHNFGRAMHASFDSSDHIRSNGNNEEKEESEDLLVRKERNKKQKNGTQKLPVLKSGDIVTLKMKLNRNNGKFAVIFAVNEIDYGVAWKSIDPPVTVGITMVGRQEQITLLSCNYKPNKNDKSCVIL